VLISVEPAEPSRGEDEPWRPAEVRSNAEGSIGWRLTRRRPDPLVAATGQSVRGARGCAGPTVQFAASASAAEVDLYDGHVRWKFVPCA